MERFLIRIVTKGPGPLRYFGLNIFQSDDYSISVDTDNKLDSLNSLPMSSISHQQLVISFIKIESEAFASLNSSVGWLCITSSPLCAEFSSLLQQLAPMATVKTFRAQTAELKALPLLGSKGYLPRLHDHSDHNLIILVFSDSGCQWNRGKLCYIAGFLVDNMCFSAFLTFYIG